MVSSHDMDEKLNRGGRIEKNAIMAMGTINITKARTAVGANNDGSSSNSIISISTSSRSSPRLKALDRPLTLKGFHPQP